MDDTLQEIRVLEKRLLDYGVRHSTAELDLLIADDFIEFGASGRSLDKHAIVKALAEEQASFSYSIGDFRVSVLSATVALATYVLIDASDTTGQRHSLRSSVWVRRGERWQIVFHQGTRGTGALPLVERPT